VQGRSPQFVLEGREVCARAVSVSAVQFTASGEVYALLPAAHFRLYYTEWKGKSSVLGDSVSLMQGRICVSIQGGEINPNQTDGGTCCLCQGNISER